jgi:pimeloyl-ACP methyl ester carboxylesterase
MRGYWPSALAPDGRYDLDSIAADAIALIGALGAERAVMIGHDWGASAALGAAILAPERVAFLITAAVPHPAAILPLPRILWGLRHFWTLRRRDAVDRLRADDFALVDRLVRRWSPAWSPPPEETAAVKEAFRQPGCLEAAVGYYRALKFPPPAWSRRAVSVPSAALCGTEDGVLAVADFERARHRYANGYTVVALPGGHFLHREHPDAFITALGKVLPSPEAVRSPAHQGRDLTQGHDSAPS